jgi:hypothetical protein
MENTTYRVWALWQDRSEQLIDLSAKHSHEAVEAAVRMGLVSGCGARRGYIGLHAVELRPVPGTLTPRAIAVLAALEQAPRLALTWATLASKVGAPGLTELLYELVRMRLVASDGSNRYRLVVALAQRPRSSWLADAVVGEDPMPTDGPARFRLVSP